MGDQLGIPSKQEREWRVEELNAILAKNLVPSSGGCHLRTFTTPE